MSTNTETRTATAPLPALEPVDPSQLTTPPVVATAITVTNNTNTTQQTPNNAQKRTNTNIPALHGASDIDLSYESKRPHRPQQPYQQFIVENRHRAVEAQIYELGAQNKYLSELYKSIDPVQKQSYQSRYDAELIEYEAAIKQQNALAASAEQSMSLQLVQQNPLQAQIPLPRVKKLMGLDDDVVQITKEAVALVNKAAEEFVMWLARRSVEVALYHGKRTLRDSDFEEALQQRPELFFLRATLLAQPNGPTRAEQEAVYQQSQPAAKRRRTTKSATQKAQAAAAAVQKSEPTTDDIQYSNPYNVDNNTQQEPT